MHPPSALRSIRLLAAAFALTLAASARGVTPEQIPIIAWAGPPANETTIERYRELAEAGFTHNYSGFSSIEAMAAALDVAQAAGLKQFVSIPELEKTPEEVAARFKSHPALAGYYLRDEPAAADFPRLAAWMKRIQAVDSAHPCYINLFPNYATPGQLGAPNYQAHVAKFIEEVPAPFISFDHYPVVGDAVTRGEWYANLETIRAAARGATKPFWAFALAVAHGPYPIATIPHLRLQAFSDLAYGAQAIQYFTYWTVKSTDWNFHEAPIGLDGKRTVVFDRVKQVTREIQAFARIFRDAEVLDVGHTGTLPAGTHAYRPEAPVTDLQTEGKGAVVSSIDKVNRRFLAVVNRDLKEPLPLRVSFNSSTSISEETKDGTSRAVGGTEFHRSLEPGDMVILSWAR